MQIDLVLALPSGEYQNIVTAMGVFLDVCSRTLQQI